MAPQPTPPPQHDLTFWLLAAGLLIYTMLAVGAAIWLPNNEKVYALLAGVMGNFSGALFLRLKG